MGTGFETVFRRIYKTITETETEIYFEKTNIFAVSVFLCAK